MPASTMRRAARTGADPGSGLRVPTELDQPVNSFSGGWRMRLQLARALMCPSDLLLLDEPTNHLDLDALVWLEAWLQKYQGTMIVISHDREFLDAVTDVTLHIANAQAHALRRQLQQVRGHARTSRWSCSKPPFPNSRTRSPTCRSSSTRFKAKASKAKQAQSRVKALERMEKVAPLLAEADFTFEFKEPGNIPNPMLSIRARALATRSKNEAPKTIHHARQRQPLGAGGPAHRHPGRQRPGQVDPREDHRARDGRRWPAP